MYINCIKKWKDRSRNIKSLEILMITCLFMIVILFFLSSHLKLSQFIHSIYTPSPSNILSSKGKHGLNVSFSERPSTDLHFRDVFNQKFSTQNLKGLDATKEKSNFLIYRCDTSTMRGCGGWADRVKGMMSAYLLANLTRRVFKIEMILPPCDMQKFIIPNLINWSLPTSIHEVVKAQDKNVHILSFIDSIHYYNLIKTTNFNMYPKMSAKYIYYKANLDYMDSFRDSLHHQREFSWMKNMTRDRINAAVFKHLFKLTPPLKNKIDTFLASNLKPTDNLVCAHVRTGRNPSIPSDTEVRIKEEDFGKIWQFLQNVSAGNGSKIFLMTDSEKVKSQSREQIFLDKFIYNGGHIFHIERSETASAQDKCIGLETLLFEQFVLMRCDVLMISKSGLSRMAAYVRGSDKNLFCFLAGQKVTPCRMSELMELYKIYG